MDWSRHMTWVFDLDGTLTVPVHDFAYARRVLGIDPSEDILGALARRTPERRRVDEDWLRAWELELAAETSAQVDAVELVAHLGRAGVRMGVLTRNTREVALRTLEAIGMDGLFHPDHVLGRACAAPKPHPEGLIEVVRRLGGTPERSVMLGDYLHDVRAGRAAGAATVLVRRKGELGWDDEADLVVESLWPLRATLPGE